MTNSNEQYKVFKYYEGLCSSGDFTKEIAKVLALGVKSKAITNLDGEVISDPALILGKNWDIVYPKPDSDFEVAYDENGELDCTNEEYEAKIKNQVSKIADTVIMKTRTTPKTLGDTEYDELTVDPSQNASYLDMYLEIYKPTYIANPEEYPLDCERKGIVPRLITKELYEESFRSKHSVEDVLDNEYPVSTGSAITKEERTDDSFVGVSQHMSYTDLADYLAAIRNITSDTSFDVPVTTATSTIKTIDKSGLSKIKQESVGLYTFFRNVMGTEPEDYILLESADVEISIESSDDTNTLYQVLIRGYMRLTTYTIMKGTIVSLSKIPNEEEVVPEMRMNGIYMPISRDYFEYVKPVTATDKAKIKFINDYSYESTRNGILVARYTYTAPTTDNLITERVPLLNNHYVLMRLFDRINYEGDGPADNVYNNNGDIIQMNSHTSEWSKLSWYRDFEELMLDRLDEDVSTSTISDGNVFVPVETPGLNSDTKIRYWINTNNDRFSLIVMGNPSLDYTEDRHLIGACYCGAIDSFENSINDTAGNFALFTSSSTEPCNTILETEKVITEMSTYTLSDDAVRAGSYDPDDFAAFYDGVPTKIATNGTAIYYVSLPENTYFDRTKWPKYIIVDGSGNPVTGLTHAFAKEFITENGKSSTLKIELSSVHEPFYSHPQDYTVGVVYNYYKEKTVITSGITRDIFGNVTNVDKVNSYGKNTSDGVTSIMMYHTRSKAYYQKHHMLFATTEEYMSKVMYGKSMYTGEYYADRIKVTHGNDGPRGILSDLLVIDSASLYALDELVINKDFEKDKYENEETFIYFPITAPYSPLSDSPNATYGLAIKKEEKEPKFTDEVALLKKAIAQLDTIYKGQWKKTQTNITPLEVCDAAVDENGQMCSVYWRVLENTAFKVINGKEEPSDYVPLQIAVLNTTAYQGNRDTNNNLITISDEGVDASGDAKIAVAAGTTTVSATDMGTKSYIKVAGFEPNVQTDDVGAPVTGDPLEDIMYGISDEKIDTLGEHATILAVMNDGSTDTQYPSETFTYPVYGVPYQGDVPAGKIEADKADVATAAEIEIINAHPDKYLVLYSVHTKGAGSDNPGEKVITKFACVPLKDTTGATPANALLRYPCDMIVMVESGGYVYKRGTGYSNKSLYLSDKVSYDAEPEYVCVPQAGYEFDNIKVVYEDPTDNSNEIVIATYDKDSTSNVVAGPDNTSGYDPSETLEADNEFYIMKLDGIQRDVRVRVSFKKTTT